MVRRSPSVRARAAIVGALAAAGCAPQAPSRPSPDAFLALHIEPLDATVRVDDRVVGSGRSVAGRFVAVVRGVHRVAVNAPGFDRFEEEFDLPPGRHERTIRLAVTPER